MATFHVTQGDTKPYTVVLKDSTQTEVDLSTASSIVVIAKNTRTKVVKINRAAATAHADQTTNTGELTYTLTTADTDTAGEYLTLIEVTFSSGVVETFPTPPSSNFILVHEDPETSG